MKIPFKFYKDSLTDDGIIGVIYAENEDQAKQRVIKYFEGFGSGCVIDNSEITITNVIENTGDLIILEKY